MTKSPLVAVSLLALTLMTGPATPSSARAMPGGVHKKGARLAVSGRPLVRRRPVRRFFSKLGAAFMGGSLMGVIGTGRGLAKHRRPTRLAGTIVFGSLAAFAFGGNPLLVVPAIAVGRSVLEDGVPATAAGSVTGWVRGMKWMNESTVRDLVNAEQRILNTPMRDLAKGFRSGALP